MVEITMCILKPLQEAIRHVYNVNSQISSWQRYFSKLVRPVVSYVVYNVNELEKLCFSNLNLHRVRKKLPLHFFASNFAKCTPHRFTDNGYPPLNDHSYTSSHLCSRIFT